MQFRFVSFGESHIVKPIEYDVILYLVLTYDRIMFCRCCLIASLPMSQRCEIIEHFGSKS